MAFQDGERSGVEGWGEFFGFAEGLAVFYGKMRKVGRLSVPKLVLSLFEDEQTSLAGYALEVRLEPA